MYIYSSSNCDSCDPNCLWCGSSTTDCTACSAANKLFLAISSTTGLGVCDASCPDGSWPNSDTQTCDSCAQGCTTCSTASVCTGCSTGYYLTAAGVCTQFCPSGTYGTGSTCYSCLAGCATCTGSSGTTCLSCSGSTTLYQT
jgi:proprotein convertase subtilisin/kexin type 5